jgi:hypothetical protein
MKKNIIALGLGIVVSLATAASYAAPVDLGSITLKQGKTSYLKLNPLAGNKGDFKYTVTCKIIGFGDDGAIKISQRYNDFGTVTLDGTVLNKVSGRETVQGHLKDVSTLVIEETIDNSGHLYKDNLNFERSKSDSNNDINIMCSAEPAHNPLP